MALVKTELDPTAAAFPWIAGSNRAELASGEGIGFSRHAAGGAGLSAAAAGGGGVSRAFFPGSAEAWGFWDAMRIWGSVRGRHRRGGRAER